MLTGDRLTSGTAVKLEVVLPSLREKQTGASLRTQGHVVRSEEIGFAAVADMGFRMRFSSSADQVVGKRSNGKFAPTGEEASAEEPTVGGRALASRFWM